MYLTFNRLVRTPTSEQYVIFESGNRLAFLHVHYSSAVHADLFLERKLVKKDYESIINEVDELCRDIKADDLIINTWSVKEIDTISDHVDWSQAPSSRSDIEALTKALNSNQSRVGYIKGFLTEAIAREYFEKLGFEVESSHKLDAAKIDLVAKSSKMEILVQVKAGDLNKSEILKCLKIMKVEAKGDFRVAFVAARFRDFHQLNRLNAERDFNCSIMLIDFNEITNTLPKYRRAL